MIKKKLIVLFILLIPFVNGFTQYCDLYIEYDSNGPVLNFFCDYNEDELRFGITINSITGGSGVYAIETMGEGILSNTLATSNNGFIYTFTENDQDNGTIGFTVFDGTTNICYMDPFIQDALTTSVEFIWCTDDFPACDNEITVDIEPADHLDLFSCFNDTTFSLDVNSVFGGDGDYIISNLGSGNLSESSIEDSVSFNYRFTQAAIDAQTSSIGFLIDDENGCTKRVDLSGKLAYSTISDFCVIIDVEAFANESDVSALLTGNSLLIESKSGQTISSTSVYNMTGELVLYKSAVGLPYVNLDCSNLAKGVYIMKSNFYSGEVFIQKLLKNQ